MSIEIGLYDTRAAVQHAIPADPEDVFRLISALSPRDWQFTVEFDRRDFAHLHMSAEPPPSPSEIRSLLGGQIVALYRGAAIAVDVDNCTYVCDLHDDPNSLRDTRYSFASREDEHMLGTIKIIGFRGASILRDQGRFEDWLIRNTSLGGKLARSTAVTIGVNLFGQRYEIAFPQTPTEIQDPVYRRESNLADEMGQLA